jgi:hypothetical protein
VQFGEPWAALDDEEDRRQIEDELRRLSTDTTDLE